MQQSGVGVANKRVDMNYDAASQLKGIKRYTDLTGTQLVAATEYNYDLAGRLQDLTHRKANNATIAPYTVAYDAADRLTQVTSIDGPNTFNYDATDQLSSATQANENYTYDLNGNRTNAGNSTGGNNQLMTDGTYNYAYDDEGNRISRTAIGTGTVTEYVWDYHNRLTQVTEKNAVGIVTRSSNYKYDMFDRRIAKTVDLDGVGTQVATTERYVYDGSHIALVFDGQGNQLQRFLYGTKVDQVLVQENANGDLLWALADYQGSVRDVVDSQGNLLNHIVYDSFGNVTSQTNGAINFRFGYTGRELDSETGLYYYRARYYDARTGQFIGQDPLSFRAGDSNLYRYAGNSPTMFSDPSGLFSLNDIKKVIGAGYLISPSPYLEREDYPQELIARLLDIQSFERESQQQIENMMNAKRADGKEPSFTDRLKAIDPLYNQAHFRKGNYHIWGPRLEQALKLKGPHHHSKELLHFYFNVTGIRGKNPDKNQVFNLQEEGLLEDFKQIGAIKNTTDEFDDRMQKSIERAIKQLQQPRYCGLSVRLTLPLHTSRNTEEEKFDPTSESFVMGHVRHFTSGGSVILTRDNRGNINVSGKIHHRFDDQIEDAADFAHRINPTDKSTQELVGGTPFKLVGEWDKGFYQDVPGSDPGTGFVHGSGYGHH